jgi:beta-phosphoglucomutase-like phosphatase (HAD superfamily)
VRTPPRSIVLDMDGVVLESTEIKTRAFAQVFAPYPEHVSAIVRFHEAHVGLSRYEKFRIIYRDILGQPLEPAALIELGREFSALVLDEILVCPLVAGAERLLEENASNRCSLHLRRRRKSFARSSIVESWHASFEASTAVRRRRRRSSDAS